ncbi:Uncharacterised protein [Yersinia intermedia]|uniref:tail fiber/spike domain-containing protein n=1 Tax=Yersinia intermedia TaxID=631 RepID=UPI0005DE0298|nr:hypothetical protein [Yersinia intermedia]CNH64943.1 Uncharacterised protein [Yersinia intermedia]
MTTYNTGNPLGSAAAKDLFDNAQNMDFALNDITQAIWTDRRGKKRKTWHAFELESTAAISQFKSDAHDAIVSFGLITLKSFQAGAPLPGNILTLANQALQNETDGEYYRWDGVLPKAVPPGSTPESTGGVGINAWISVGDAALRSNLRSNVVGMGAALVGTENGDTVQQSLRKLNEKYATIKRDDGFYLSTFTGAKTFNIPSDYPNMQAAVDDLHIQTTTQGEYIILNLEANYKEKYGLKVQHGDFSRFYIKSATGIVQVADDFIGVAGLDGGTTITSGTVIMAYHARGPVLGCIFDGRQIARTLYFALGGSYGWSDRSRSSTEELPNPIKISGGTNFRHATFEAQEGSVIVCENVVATGCLLNSIYCERNSTIHAEFSDASGSGQAGVIATRGSRVNADTMNVSNCKIGVWASRGAVISASDTKADNCSIYGFYADMAATINAHNSSALNAGTGMPSDVGNFVNPGASYHAYRGSKINATTGKATGSLYGVSAIIDSDVAAFGLVANQTKIIGVTARYSSRVSVDNCTMTGTIGKGILAADGATISANSGNMQGGITVAGASTGGEVVVSLGQVKGGVTGCYADTGGKITATGATVTGNSSVDIRINTGGIIVANGATYGTANTTTNTLTTFGIIFS